MGSFSDYAEIKILEHLVGKTSWTMPTMYIALSTADPTDDASGLAEPFGGSYARVATAGGDWDAASGGAIANANDIDFPEATGAWGTITHFALFDAATAGNMLVHGSVTPSQPIASGNTVRLAAGDLDITLD